MRLLSAISYTNQAMLFSKSNDGQVYLTTNFQVKEFACSDGSDAILIHPFIPLICQVVRNKFNMPFTPNSAYRTVAHNKNVKGANKSNHIYGRAVDIPAKNGVTPKQLYDYVDSIFGNWGEIGIYNWGIHVGIQDNKKRFTDASYKG